MHINIPPIGLNFMLSATNIKSMPKYIGFLESEKTPDVTRSLAASGFRGLTVVWCFLNKRAAKKSINTPISKHSKLNSLVYIGNSIENNDLE